VSSLPCEILLSDCSPRPLVRRAVNWQCSLRTQQLLENHSKRGRGDKCPALMQYGGTELRIALAGLAKGRGGGRRGPIAFQRFKFESGQFHVPYVISFFRLPHRTIYHVLAPPPRLPFLHAFNSLFLPPTTHQTSKSDNSSSAQSINSIKYYPGMHISCPS
jgi:hypothetical protein